MIFLPGLSIFIHLVIVLGVTVYSGAKFLLHGVSKILK